MKLTSHTNYAIRMLMFCASKQELATVSEIARFYDLPEKFLFKILGGLTTLDLVETVRGRNGGIRLSRPADQIRLGEVVRRVEENFEMAECFKQGEISCPLVATCGMNGALSRALQAFFDVLDEYTIADLIRKEHNINVLLELNLAMQEPLLRH
ncbi:MAG: iron-responsive transcriptional regulator RirA [Rhizobiaceae bacterium]|nr:iron-responsive transcriptional regulator RirA [Rhizobiaceae bacterium]